MKLFFSPKLPLIAIAISCGALSTTSQAESLLEIFQQAQKNDHTFRAAQATFNADSEAQNQGRSGLLPKINGSATFSQSDIDRDGLYPYETTPTTLVSNSTQYAITLSQPLFDMAAWYNYKASKATKNIAQAQFESAKLSLITRAAEAYFDTLQAVENFNTSKAEETALGEQLAQAKQRFDVGLVAITDVHQAQAAYDSAYADRLIAEGQIDIAFNALEAITGESYQQLSPLKDDFPVIAPVPANRQEWVAMAVSKNSALSAKKQLANAQTEKAKAAKAGHYPTLSASASISKLSSNTDIDDIAYSDYNDDTKTIGLTLSVPLYNGGVVSSARRQAAQQAIAAKEDFLQTKRDITQAARSLHLTVVTSVATVKARKQAILSSQSALDAVKAGYDVGTRDLLDVLTAQRNLYRAQRDHLNALYAYVINSLKLKEVAGTLSEQDVIDLSQWLNLDSPVMRAQSTL